MPGSHTPVTRKIREETGFSIGDYIVNHVVKKFSNKWVDNRTIWNSIYTTGGYQISHAQVTGTMDRWHRERSYRTDGTLYKHETARGTYMWQPDEEQVSPPATKPVRPAKIQAELTTDPNVKFVTEVVGGYLVKIEGDLYVARKLEI